LIWKKTRLLEWSYQPERLKIREQVDQTRKTLWNRRNSNCFTKESTLSPTCSARCPTFIIFISASLRKFKHVFQELRTKNWPFWTLELVLALVCGQQSISLDLITSQELQQWSLMSIWENLGNISQQRWEKVCSGLTLWLWFLDMEVKKENLI